MTLRVCGRPPKLTAAQQNELARWQSVGTNITEASKHFGVSRETLRRYVRGINKAPRRAA